MPTSFSVCINVFTRAEFLMPPVSEENNVFQKSTVINLIFIFYFLLELQNTKFISYFQKIFYIVIKKLEKKM
jgi:hypothetical protein